MGRKNRKTSKSLRPLENVNDSVAISKQRKFEKELKEKEFIENFEERQKVNAAVSLKSDAVPNVGYPNATPTPLDKKAKKQKRRNDGNSAIHQTVKQMIVGEVAKGNGKANRHKGKRKVTFSSESSGNEYYADNSVQKSEVGRKESNKRMKMTIETDSDATSTAEDLIATNGQFSDDSMEDEEESLDDDLDEEEEEIGEDLEDEELEEADDDELRNGNLEDEEEANSSFFTSDDESLEDEIGEESGEEPFELEFVGYQSTAKSAKCLLLEALEDYTIATSPFVLFKFSDGIDHSVQVANKALQWIVSPVDSQTFFNDFFNKRVLVVNRKAKDYFEGFFGTVNLFKMLQKFDLDIGTDVNLSLYENDVPTDHNCADGERATAAAVWAHFGRGRAAQFDRPQCYNDNIWYLCDVLQELFCSFVGAKCYLTPPNTSAIAPHWEDSDAFLLQIEGRKYFKVYSPASDEDTSPLNSSGTMSESDFDGREPTFEGWLEQGDTLYIPKGWIFKASAGDVHSLCVFVSICRDHSFTDFLEKASAEFVKTMVSGSKHLRKNLPPLLFDMAGNSGNDYPGEETLEEKIIPVAEVFSRKFGENFAAFVPSYIDLMAREFFRFALPPLLTPVEETKICFGGAIDSSLDIGKKTEVRLVRKHTQRLLFENAEKAFIVHRMANSRSCEEYPEKTIDFPIEFEDGFVTLVDSYPNWLEVGELGLESQEANVELAKLLFTNGILLVQREKSFGGEEEKEKEEKRGKEAEKDKRKAEEGTEPSKKAKKRRAKRKEEARKGSRTD
ncbi:hypothetical protein niasHS_010967 [Heterodera schachtii]|uniref:Bifunctional lysine-specific demethylase and histidyl-hydroxylase n=1 Tax=Heterodera schachtii TaxID=97005 RepID=A0ABD2IZ66_HETSC